MTDEPTSHKIERLPTGVPGLDQILMGGFLVGGTYIVTGPPGAGKTVLGNQICFHHVANGGRALYVTLLAESPARMLVLLEGMRFFDASVIASSLKYLSAYKTLEQEGLEGLVGLLRDVIREHKATVLMIDGLVSAEAVAESELAFKKFIHELHTLVTYLGCTTFLLTNGSARPVQPENTMVDGLVEVSDKLVGLSAVRELVVRKFRGSAHLRGRHFFDISDDGVRVYPRAEALFTTPTLTPADLEGRATLGIEGFDHMLRGGLGRGSSSLALGPVGSGKTMIGLHFLAAGAAARENGLYFGFYESPPRVAAKGDAIGLDITGRMAAGQIEIMWQPPVDLLIDALAEKVLAAVRRRNVQRLFIDGINGFKEASVYPERISRFFAAFTNELRAAGVTTLLSEETRQFFGPNVEVPSTGLSAVIENVIFLRQVEIGSQLRRLISILKTRDSHHDTALREFDMTDRGIQIGEPFNGAEEVMTGMAKRRRK